MITLIKKWISEMKLSNRIETRLGYSGRTSGYRFNKYLR